MSNSVKLLLIAAKQAAWEDSEMQLYFDIKALLEQEGISEQG